MSGDVQPRKRKDKKRRKEDDDVAKPVPSPTTNIPGQQTSKPNSSEDVQFHVHSDHGTGGHWCAKIIFFILMAILAGLVGLILLENRGISDLDTPLSESRFADYLEGWVEEKRESHDDHDDHSLDELLNDDHDATEPFSEEAISEDEDDDHDDAGHADHDDHDDDNDDDGHEEDDEENSEEANDENDEPSVSADDEEIEQQNDDDETNDDNAEDADDNNSEEENQNDLENNDSDNSNEEEIVEHINSANNDKNDDAGDDDGDDDNDDDGNDGVESNEDNEQDTTEKPETDAADDDDNDDDPFEESLNIRYNSAKSLNDTNSSSMKPKNILENRQVTPKTVLAPQEPLVTVENLKDQVKTLYDTYNKIADNLNMRKFDPNQSIEDDNYSIKNNQTEDDDHDDDASFEQVIENDDGEELHLQKLAKNDEVTGASLTADDEADGEQSSESSSLAVKIGVGLALVVVGYLVLAKKTQTISADDEQRNELNEYKRRLTLVTTEEPIPSDIDDEQPIEDDLYDDEDLDEELNGEDDDEQDETEPEEDDLEYSEEDDDGGVIEDEVNIDAGTVSDNEETIKQGGTITSFEKMQNMYLPRENSGDNKTVVKFSDDIIIADEIIIPKQNISLQQQQHSIKVDDKQKEEQQQSVQFSDDGDDIDIGGSIKVQEEGGEIDSANNDIEISDDNEDELEENYDEESIEGEDEDEDDISEDADEDIDEEDVSDVDDSELMKRLESKYGKLPEETIAAPPSNARDDDDEDSSWTKIKKSGAQSIDDDDDNNNDGVDEDIEEQLRRANELLEENPNVALKMFNELMTTEQRQASIKIRYGRAKALDRLAEINKSNKILDNAITEYQNLIIELGSKLSNGFYKKITERCIELMRFKGQHLKAIELHNAIIERFNDQPSYRNELAITYLLINRMEEAKQVLNETLLHWPNDGVAAVHYGFILKNLDNNLEKAVTFLEKGINSSENGTNDGRFYFALGDALMRLGRPNRARLVYKKGAANGLFLSEYQRSLYNVNRLKSKPFWTKQETNAENYFQILELNWKKIRDEGLSVLKKSGGFTNEAENLRNTGDWKQFDLFARGRKIVKHCERTPFTCKIIETFPAARFCSRGQVKFSVMHPGTHIWPHCGPTNCRIRAHLGLKVPENTLIRVANETRTWEDGKLLIFDDSFEHEVWHNGTSLRLVLIVDIWHPDLTEEERSSLYPI